MYKLTAKTTEYKPGDAIIRRHDAWNLEGDAPTDMGQILGALSELNLIPASLARPVDTVMMDSPPEYLQCLADRLDKFYGCDNSTLSMECSKDGQTVLTIEIPPIVSVYTFRTIDEEAECEKNFQRLADLRSA
jgi:hypothetical protein